MKAKILRRSLMMMLLATSTIAFAQESKKTKTHKHPHKEGWRSEIHDSQIRKNFKRNGMGSIQAYNLHRQYHNPVHQEKHQIVKQHSPLP